MASEIHGDISQDSYISDRSLCSSMLAEIPTSSVIHPKNTMEFLSMTANNLETTVGFFLTDEQFTDMLHEFCDSFESAQFGSILSGTKHEHYRSQPGYRVPQESGYAADIAAGDNVADLVNNPPNNVNGDQNEAEGGNEGADNAADGDGDGAEGGNGGGTPRTVIIYRYELGSVNMQINLVEQINTNIIPSNCQSWNDLAENILLVWRHRDAANMNYPADHVTPPNCWPRAFTIFGNRSDDNRFQSYDWRNELNWEHVRASLDCVLAIEIVNGLGLAENGVPRELGNGPFYTCMYRLQLQQMQISLAHYNIMIPANKFESWDHLARIIFRGYSYTNDLNIVGNPDFIDAFNCWPRAVTLFGTWVPGRFQSIIWQTTNWEDIRSHLNCLVVIKNP
ncbi:hypothetical protein RND81_11G181900 [Saponaria officinalis]|uniref:Uncharacterized protein n=1 Tax=Saponaria officinalis TaxID=3572 RepID=A0AAW1HQC2_SAPOF